MKGMRKASEIPGNIPERQQSQQRRFLTVFFLAKDALFRVENISWTTKGMRQSQISGEEGFHPLPHGNHHASIPWVPAPTHREAGKLAAGGGEAVRVDFGSAFVYTVLAISCPQIK